MHHSSIPSPLHAQFQSHLPKQKSLRSLNPKKARGEKPPISIIHILRHIRRIELVIQKHLPASPHRRGGQSGKGEGTRRCSGETDVLCRVSGERGAVDPEAEKSVRVWVTFGGRDEDLGEGDVAD